MPVRVHPDKRGRGCVGMLVIRRMAIASVLGAAALASGCSDPLYEFPDISPSLPAGQVNLIENPSFESPTTEICADKCSGNGIWSLEHTTAGAPAAELTPTGAVDGERAVHLTYEGRDGDDGEGFVEIYMGAGGPAAIPGSRLTFTLWVSGSCEACAPFIGIEAFDADYGYLGEHDQYFDVPKSPRPVQVSYELPAGTRSIAAYLQVPEIYSSSAIDMYVDNAILTSEPAPQAG